jgi:hypothetical protein
MTLETTALEPCPGIPLVLLWRGQQRKVSSPFCVPPEGASCMQGKPSTVLMRGHVARTARCPWELAIDAVAWSPNALDSGYSVANSLSKVSEPRYKFHCHRNGFSGVKHAMHHVRPSGRTSVLRRRKADTGMLHS